VFERLTREVRAAVVAAQEIAREEGDDEVTPTHLLTALTRGDGRVPALLADHGIAPETIAEARGRGRAPTSAPDRRPLDDDDAEALRALGIDLRAIRRAVEASFGEGALDTPTHSQEDPDTDPADDVVTDEPADRGDRRRFSFGGNPRFGSTSKKSLELALREAIRARSRDVRDEHLALGILRADDDGIRTLLHALDVDVRALRDDLEGRGRRTA
jgi:ATP-dependent Clp protease ATP-binding subunit ClpA